MKLSVAFTPFVDPRWTGGAMYLRNLFSALSAVPGRPLQPLLFVPPGTDPARWQALRPHLDRDPIEVPAWSRRRALRLLGAAVSGRDDASERAFRDAGVGLVFENDVWFGRRFGLPTLAWIADFQHCRLPRLFSWQQRWLRSAKYRAYSRHAGAVMVSSDDGRRDCERWFPVARGQVQTVPFAVELPPSVLQGDPAAVAARHKLPGKFLFFPSQMWQHKNHLLLVQALGLLKARGVPVVVAASGHAADVFRPGYPAQVAQAVQDLGVQQQLRFLGHVPYDDILPLMRASAAVLNPSLFEGWSTTVEEAKALAVPLLLSDLPVHREQAPAGTRFFDAGSAVALADVLQATWVELAVGPRDAALENAAVATYCIKRAEFGRRFIEVAQIAVAAHGR